MTVEKFQYSLAVVIGVDDYRNGVPSLKTPVNDAQTLATILQDRHGYDVKLLLNEAANCTALKDLLETELPQRLTKDDRLLFYFAGHGIALNGDDGPEGYLIPYGASLGDISTYLSMVTVNQTLLKLPCRHFLGILDCCFAGAFRWSSTRKLVPINLGTLHKERFERFIRDPAWQVITSAASDQFAQDAFDLKSTQRGLQGNHSPFAAALIEALKEGSADAYPPAEADRKAGDGVITATELYLYLRDRVEPDKADRAIRQTPGIFPLTKHDKGEYIFLAPGHPFNLPPAPPLDVSRNPYRGLESFGEAQKDLFFGRQALTQALTEFVIAQSLTVVLGASGSGKSSLVKAGLLPKLRQVKDWYILPTLRPGELPFKALNQALTSVELPAIEVGTTDGVTITADQLIPAQSLARLFKAYPNAHFLFVIDQFEELITLCRDERERQQFFDFLAALIASYPNQLHLVLTLRSDFEPQFRNMALEPNWQGARFVVPAMTREELRQAIEAPASARVMVFDPHDLVDQLIDEVANMPGALPLLSFALSELYLNYLHRQDEARSRGETLDRAITQADYEELGGVTRSLTQRAEREYDALVQQDAAYANTIRNVMLRMISVGGEQARRQVPASELIYPEPERGRVNAVISRFENARLLTSGTDTEEQVYQEPAHDALVRGWKRLLDWKRQHLGSVILQRELTSDATQWQMSNSKKRDAGLLWIEDPRLPTALQLSCGKTYKDTWLHLFWWWFRCQSWQSQPRDYWLNTLEVDFVWQSFDQKFKRFGRTAIALASVILALTSVTSYALQRAAIAQLREQSARVLNWLSTTNAAEGLVLAIYTLDQSQTLPTVESTAQSSLLSAIQVAQEANRLLGHRDSVISVAFSPDGKSIVSGSGDKTVRLWDAQTGKPIGQPMKRHDKSVLSVAFSPDGKRIVSSSEDNTLQLWDIQTEKPLGEPLQGHQAPIRSVAFSPDGKRIVSGSEDSTIRIWDAQTGKPIGEPLQGHTKAIYSVVFNSNGQSIVSGSGDNTIRLWDAETRELIRQLRGHSDPVSAVAFSPDGNRIVSGSGDNSVRLWDTQTGKPIGQPLQGHKVVVSSVAFSPDGKRIVSGSWDKTVRLWDAQTGEPIGQPLQGHGAPVSSVAFSPDSQRIVSGSGDKTVRLWDAQIGQPISQSLARHHVKVSAIAFSPDGRRRVSAGENNTVQQWNVQTKQPIGQPLQGHGAPVRAVAFSPDGKRIISGSDDKTVWVWDAQIGQPIGQPLQGHEAPVRAVAFSLDGKRIVSGSEDKTVRLWDAQTGQPIGQLHGHETPVISVVFSPDSKFIISGSEDNGIRIWDVSPADWLKIACDRLQYHPLLNQPEKVTTDPELLNVSYRARDVCQALNIQKQKTISK